MKRTDKSYLALLMTFGERLHFETHRLEHALERFSSLERHVYYDYIGGEDRPSTQSISPRTNPEMFMPQQGYQVILDGLIQLRNEIFSAIEMLDDDKPQDTQSPS
jgi:hypothetical protein